MSAVYPSIIQIVGRNNLQLAGGSDQDLLAGLAALAAVRLDLADDVHAFGDLAEDDVLAVQPRGLLGADEELASICVWSSVGHGEDTRASVPIREKLVSIHPNEVRQVEVCKTCSMRSISVVHYSLQGEVLVGELLTVDALAASTVLLGEVTTLEHELWDDAVEWGASVAEALLAGAESAEVLSGLLETTCVSWLLQWSSKS